MALSENMVVRLFSEFLDAQPFKVHLEKEFITEGCRADIRLPDYGVVIEAKGGSQPAVKKAIGQAIAYSEQLDESGYILIEDGYLREEHISWADRADIGIITIQEDDYSESGVDVRVAKDVGGLDVLEYMRAYQNPPELDEPRRERGSYNKEVLGGN